MNLFEFNNLQPNEAMKEIQKCCGSHRWAEELVAKRPYQSIEELKKTSDVIWFHCDEHDWLEAFSHHPEIGDLKSVQQKFANTHSWAEGEQAGVSGAGEEVLTLLADANKMYKKVFGYLYIVCATGKSADDMLYMLNQRLTNSPEDELLVAMKEQNKITHLRIDKLFS